MIPSRFNLAVTDFPGAGRHILYNTRSQAQVVIDNELRDCLAALPAEPARPETSQAFAQLQKMGFIVPSADVEEGSLEQFFHRFRDDASVLQPTILTTYACNFACVYCVEEGVSKGAPMNAEEGEAAAAYVIAQLRRFGSRQIKMFFYGGEPLLNMTAVRVVARRLHAFSDAEGVPFSFELSTNGSLMTQDVVAELKPLGLTGTKITLDGPKDLHDAYRPLQSGKGTYDLLLQNIRAAVDLISIKIEVNFDQGNFDRVGELLDTLAAEGLHRKIGRLLFNPIMPRPKDRELTRSSAEVPCALMSMDYARRLLALRRLALEKGFPVDTAVEAHVCEMLTKRTHFIVDPRGALYRCGGLVGRPEFAFGNIAGPENDAYMGRELWRRCAQCACAPLCGDGCPLASYVRYGDPLRLDCEKEAMEHFVRESLKLTYLAKQGKRPA